MLPDQAATWSEARRTAYIHALNEGLKLQKEVWYANHELYCEIDLPKTSQMYRILFERTKVFTATLGNLLHTMADTATPRQRAETACLAIDWSIHVLHNERAQFEHFLHSQRESIYWMLDETVLKFLVDQWDKITSKTPWDKAIEPLRIAILRGESLMPGWAEQDLEVLRKWNVYSPAPGRDVLEQGYFRRSRRFLYQSSKIFEVWRTMRLWAGGQLPAELMNAIVEDVSKAENLPMQNLRTLYFPKGKGKEKTDAA